MELTNKQKLLLRGLMILEVSKDTMQGVFMALETEQQQEQMLKYMAKFMTVPELGWPTEQELLTELWRIRGVGK